MDHPRHPRDLTLLQVPTKLISQLCFKFPTGQRFSHKWFQGPSARVLPRCPAPQGDFPASGTHRLYSRVLKTCCQAYAGISFPPFLTQKTWTWPSRWPSRLSFVRSSLSGSSEFQKPAQRAPKNSLITSQSEISSLRAVCPPLQLHIGLLKESFWFLCLYFEARKGKCDKKKLGSANQKMKAQRLIIIPYVKKSGTRSKSFSLFSYVYFGF